MYFCDEHRGITRYYEILKSSVCEKYQLRQMEYDILMFLYNNPQHNTAADIVRYRKSTKSHVSMSLKVLEEKGLIERRIDKDNKKRVEIYLLDSADDIIKEAENRIISMIDEHEITRKAYEKKVEIIETANEMSREISKGTKEYADNVLSGIEVALEDALKVIRNNRKELK